MTIDQGPQRRAGFGKSAPDVIGKWYDTHSYCLWMCGTSIDRYAWEVKPLRAIAKVLRGDGNMGGFYTTFVGKLETQELDPGARIRVDIRLDPGTEKIAATYYVAFSFKSDDKMVEAFVFYFDFKKGDDYDESRLSLDANLSHFSKLLGDSFRSDHFGIVKQWNKTIAPQIRRSFEDAYRPKSRLRRVGSSIWGAVWGAVSDTVGAAGGVGLRSGVAL